MPEKYFLFVSTIEPRKNLFGIIQAMKDLPEDVCLVVAGERGWKSAGRFLISKKKIKFLGYVNENDKWQLYREAIALVYPSFYEGFGLPILESMAAGCPIIAGNNSSQGEVLADCGLLVDPFNVVEISQAMNLMLTDEKLRQEFISRGLARSKEFSWQKTAREVLEIFENLS